MARFENRKSVLLFPVQSRVHMENLTSATHVFPGALEHRPCCALVSHLEESNEVLAHVERDRHEPIEQE